MSNTQKIISSGGGGGSAFVNDYQRGYFDGIKYSEGQLIIKTDRLKRQVEMLQDTLREARKALVIASGEYACSDNLANTNEYWVIIKAVANINKLLGEVNG